MRDHHHEHAHDDEQHFGRRYRGRPGAPGFGGAGGFGPGFGGPWFGPGRGHGGPGGRARKGDVRSVILILLADGPSNGYGLIKAIQTKTAGLWRPSPGSVYPTLQQLVDEGLIASTGDGPRPEFELTDEGKAYVEENRETLAAAWTASSNSWHEHGELIEAAAKLAGVVKQVAQVGTAEQRTAAATKLDDLRRELYRMLGE
ncbi:MAG: PadR family transcriptional regulator [Pseudolysinimonas sp.]